MEVIKIKNGDKEGYHQLTLMIPVKASTDDSMLNEVFMSRKKFYQEQLALDTYDQDQFYWNPAKTSFMFKDDAPVKPGLLLDNRVIHSTTDLKNGYKLAFVEEK